MRNRNTELFTTYSTSLSTLDCEDLIHVAVTGMLCELFIAILSVHNKTLYCLCCYLHVSETISQVIA